MIGASLASTDAVTLRDVLRDERVAPSVRRALGVEAGVNDVFILPVLLVFAAVASDLAQSPAGWVSFLGRLLLLGPVVGALIGACGATVVGRISARRIVREEYQSLFGIGLVLLAYVSGEALGGSGFVAVFAAGLAVNTVNHELCDCFLTFGQILAEVLLLVAFVLFGAMLSGVLTVASAPLGFALAALVLVVVRPVAIVGALAARRSLLSRPARLVIAWFGPRGLASLLLALLVVQGGVPGGDLVVQAVGWVVVVSVFVHGVTTTPVAAWYGRQAAAVTLPESREGEGLDVLVDHGSRSTTCWPISRAPPRGPSSTSAHREPGRPSRRSSQAASRSPRPIWATSSRPCRRRRAWPSGAPAPRRPPRRARHGAPRTPATRRSRSSVGSERGATPASRSPDRSRPASAEPSGRRRARAAVTSR